MMITNVEEKKIRHTKAGSCSLLLAYFCLFSWLSMLPSCSKIKNVAGLFSHKKASPSSHQKGQGTQQTPGAKPQMPPPPPVFVEARPLHMHSFKITLSASGFIMPYRQSQIASALAGRITSVRIQEGQKVKKDDVLATIEDQLHKYYILEKEAECRRLEAEVKRLQTGYLVEEIRSQKEIVQEQEAQLRGLDAELKRKKELYLSQNISKNEWDEVRFKSDAQQARLQKAREDLALLERGFREEVKASAQAELEKTQAQLDGERYLLLQTEIKAPFDGTILQKYVEVGEWVKEGTVVASVIDISKVKVTVFVPERYLPLVEKKKQTQGDAQVLIDALPDRKDIVGKVIEIVPEASAKDRNFTVRLLVENADNVIQSGMSCRVFAVFREVPNALLIHRDAFVNRGAQTLAIKIVTDTASNTSLPKYFTITIGGRDGDWFEILDSSYSFPAKMEFSKSLDQGKIPEEMSQTFAKNMCTLSSDHVVELVKSDEEWRLCCKNPEQTYRVVREIKENALMVYSSEKLKAGDKMVITNNPNVYPEARLIVEREYP